MVKMVVAGKDSCPQAHSRASEQLMQLQRGKLFPTYRRPRPGTHSQDSTWPGGGPPPARIALQKRRGAPGRGQELPAPAWARRHTGRNVPSSAGPPSACRLPHPGIAECNPTAGGGCSQQRQQAPLQPPAFDSLLCTEGSQGNLGVSMQTWRSAGTKSPKELTTPGLQGWHTMPRAVLVLYPG